MLLVSNSMTQGISNGNENLGNVTKGGLKSEDTGDFLHCQDKYSKSLS